MRRSTSTVLLKWCYGIHYQHQSICNPTCILTNTRLQHFCTPEDSACVTEVFSWDLGMRLLLLLSLFFPPSLFFSLLLLHVRPLLLPLLLSSAFSLSSLHPPQQTIMVENANLRAEIRKLRVENSDLLRRVRFADTNAHYMRVSAKSQVGPRMIKTPRWSQAPLSSPPVWSIHRRDKGYSVSSSIFLSRGRS